MFDAETTRLIRAAPRITGVDPDILPQELTRIYAELAAIRVRTGEAIVEAEQKSLLERLRRIAIVYEAAVDMGASGEARRAAAFVAGTAHHVAARFLEVDSNGAASILTSAAIHPSLAAPLLFLIAEQNPDAREAARALHPATEGDLLTTALIESVRDLAAERFDQILERAIRLRRFRLPADTPLTPLASQALYGLCWTGLVQMVAGMLDRAVPESPFLSLADPGATFDRVVELATENIRLDQLDGGMVSSFSGPRHLARLLRHVADGLENAGVANLPPPDGVDGDFWRRWLQHRAKTKPVLWRNHRAALETGFLEPGRSGVLVLPTGAGKTTLSELKIASALGSGRKVVFLVPTLALVDQLRDDLAESFPTELSDVAVRLEVSGDGDLAALVAGPELKAIEVMTPERFLALLSFAEAEVEDVGLVVFDECHLLSPNGGGSRSLDAMLCLLHALKRAPDADFLLLSAMITNGPEVAAWLAGVTRRPCVSFHDLWKPSRQARGVVVYQRSDLRLERRYVKGSRRKTKLMAPIAVPYALFGLQHHWSSEREADVRLIRLLEDPVPLSISSSDGVAPNANVVAAQIATDAARAGLKTIIFVQQADHAPSTARRVAASLGTAVRLTTAEQKLWAAVQAEVGGEACSLLDPTAGALPHNGDMIALERRLTESLFRRGDGAAVVVATPTLAQGMNLPAELAVLAGNKRHDEEGRLDLQQHEVLNAAGRAGRAGHLANGTVVLIPEPVVTFSADGAPEANAFRRLKSLLPPNDQCVEIDDPLTQLLDGIQIAGADYPRVRYLLSRLRAGEPHERANETALSIVRRSFAAFQAKTRQREDDFDAKIAALQEVLEGVGDSSDTFIQEVAAFAGLPVEPLSAISASLKDRMESLPTTVVGWSEWLIEFFCDNPVSFHELFGPDVATVQHVVRGKKKGGPPTPAELRILKRGIKAWLEGQPFREIELALGVAADRVRHCARTRDLVLKLANRRLYIVAAALSELAQRAFADAGRLPEAPAVLDVLAVAFRQGLHTPELVAFAHLYPKIRSRVLLHREFKRKMSGIHELVGQDYAAVLSYVRNEDILRLE